MTTHTSGPWEASCIGYGSNIKPDIAWIGYGTSYPKEVHKANARLIAAAPELLHALQLVMTWNGIYDQSVASAPKAIAEFNMQVGDKIRSAISKATTQP